MARLKLNYDYLRKPEKPPKQTLPEDDYESASQSDSSVEESPHPTEKNHFQPPTDKFLDGLCYELLDKNTKEEDIKTDKEEDDHADEEDWEDWKEGSKEEQEEIDMTKTKSELLVEVAADKRHQINTRNTRRKIDMIIKRAEYNFKRTSQSIMDCSDKATAELRDKYKGTYERCLIGEDWRGDQYDLLTACSGPNPDDEDPDLPEGEDLETHRARGYHPDCTSSVCRKRRTFAHTLKLRLELLKKKRDQEKLGANG